jgi:membrane protease subunit HflC
MNTTNQPPKLINLSKEAKLIAIAVAVFLIILNGSIYIVEQQDQAIVLQFGEPVSVKNEPGLYFKLPYFLQDVIKYDKRILDVNLQPKTLPDVNQKQVIIDAFVKYRIIDPLKFYKTLRNYSGLSREVDSILMASLKNTVGNIPFQDLLSDKRSQIMAKIRNNVTDKADEFGVEIVDLRIVRADLPEENINSIFNRMIAEREKEAREFRAQGEEEAKKITSRADKQRTILIAEARKKSEIIRGEGDGEASKIFANSFGKDADFFAFYRSMQAYRESIKKTDTTMILSPDSEFLKYIENMNR